MLITTYNLQLAIGSAKELTPELSPLLKKVRAIVGHYKHTSQAQERLDSYQKVAGNTPLHLIQDIDTRWNSEYAMLRRLLELREPITLDMAKHGSLVDCLTGTEWRIASDYVKVLKPLAEATVEAEGEKYPTLSCQVPSLYCIFQSLKCVCDQDMTAEGKTFSTNVEKSLITRFPDYNMDKDACIAMFCDPRYKTVIFRNDSAREEWLKTVAQEQLNYADAGEYYGNEQEGGAVASSSLWAAFDTMAETQDQGNNPSKEIRAYIDDKTISRNADPCKWWKEMGQHKYPAVARLARKYLAIPATSASSERAFSAAGSVATPCRAALLPEHVRQLTFLHGNL
ncbi:zinc finger BED domain-containing protein 4-like [Ornithodoros turicata]|uniref:zinc finger BED domain-containing protein 4-like n=1 Tax=Ornithodoros turicata TaxID=34597 RepID=UPI003139136C